MLGRVQALRCAPALRAPSAAWTRLPRGSHGAIIVGGRSNPSNGKNRIGVPRPKDEDPRPVNKQVIRGHRGNPRPVKKQVAPRPSAVIRVP